MANIAYEIAVRLGVAAHLVSDARRSARSMAEREMAEERTRPLSSLGLPSNRPVFWLHAVSMGEVGVARVLVRELKAQNQNAIAVISTSTAAGFDAAGKIENVDAVVAARFDTRSLMSTMFEAIRPSAIVLVEGDLWRNMIAIARRRGVPVFIANAKLSEKSLAFYRHFPSYSRSIFSRINYAYSQTGLYRDRLIEAGLPADRCDVAGNVKLDMIVQPPSRERLDDILNIADCVDASEIVTFGSLHPGEEVAAIRGMQRVWKTHPRAHCLIAPRHIEKTPLFVESIRREFGVECRVYSDQGYKGSSRITIVDKMGMLMDLYALANAGVVGGTYVESVGGHNLTEPAFLGKPVIYGPYIQKQLGLHDLVASYEAGIQSTVEEFPEVLAALIDDPAEAGRLGANGERMVADSRGVAARIVEDIGRRMASVHG